MAGSSTAEARVAPATGTKPETGFPTKITLSGDPNIDFWEKEVTPPGLEGGDPVDTTTMFNTTYRTKGAKVLAEMTEFSTRVTYDPLVLPQLLLIINSPDDVTITFWDGSTWDFWGYLRSFKPAGLNENGQPEADIVIVPTMTDPTDQSEQEPNYTAPA